MGGERRGGGITYGMSAGEGGGARTPDAIRRGGDRAFSSGESSGDTRGGAAVSGGGFGSGAWLRWRRRRRRTVSAGGVSPDA